MNAGVSNSRRLFVSCTWCALLEDEELARDVTYDRQYLIGQQHVVTTVDLCAINLNLRIDECQVRFPEFGHAHVHH